MSNCVYKKIIGMISAIIIISITGCSAFNPIGNISNEKKTRTIFAMDTVMELTIFGDEAALDSAQERIKELESILSVTNEDSDVSRINESAGQLADVSTDTANLLEAAIELCRDTKGTLDISLYPIVRAWGFTTGDNRIPDEAEIKKLLDVVDYSKITVNIGMDSEGNTIYSVGIQKGMAIDLGSVAKGYTGDCIKEQLLAQGVTSALITLGGNVQAVGKKPDGSPWKIAVADPSNPGEYLGAMKVDNLAVVTSGGYQRYFEENGKRYHHIMDPMTGAPAESGLVSVTVVGESGILCDAMSTALFVMGLEDGTKFWKNYEGFDAVFVTENGNVYITEGLEDIFSILNGSSVQVIRK